MAREIYVGLMSGTSLDGVDACVVDLSGGRFQVAAGAHLPFESELRGGLLALNVAGGDEIHRASVLGVELAHRYAAATRAALDAAGVSAADVRAIGCHGQTIRHRPELGYTVQLANPALLAELCGIRVVADFRSRDIAAGGQGAPLAPAFHVFAFGGSGEDRVVLNLGGIANLTWLPRSGPVMGFDCGPGNCLMDLWAHKHLGTPMDAGGNWASSGEVDRPLLDRFLAEPYLAAPPPKSTGRDLFNESWLLEHGAEDPEPAATQATLLEFSARCVSDAQKRFCASARKVIVCGGGARNTALMSRLGALCAPAEVVSSESHGLEPEQVEPVAFAWLAKMAMQGEPANLPAVTGARGLRVLGAIYPA